MQQIFSDAADEIEIAQHLPESHERELIGMVEQFTPGFSHFIASQTEEFQPGVDFEQLQYQTGSVQVPGNFCGRY